MAMRVKEFWARVGAHLRQQVPILLSYDVSGYCAVMVLLMSKAGAQEAAAPAGGIMSLISMSQFLVNLPMLSEMSVLYGQVTTKLKVIDLVHCIHENPEITDSELQASLNEIAAARQAWMHIQKKITLNDRSAASDGDDSSVHVLIRDPDSKEEGSPHVLDHAKRPRFPSGAGLPEASQDLACQQGELQAYMDIWSSQQDQECRAIRQQMACVLRNGSVAGSWSVLFLPVFVYADPMLRIFGQPNVVASPSGEFLRSTSFGFLGSVVRMPAELTMLALRRATSLSIRASTSFGFGVALAIALGFPLAGYGAGWGPLGLGLGVSAGMCLTAFLFVKVLLSIRTQEHYPFLNDFFKFREADWAQTRAFFRSGLGIMAGSVGDFLVLTGLTQIASYASLYLNGGRAVQFQGPASFLLNLILWFTAASGTALNTQVEQEVGALVELREKELMRWLTSSAQGQRLLESADREMREALYQHQSWSLSAVRNRWMHEEILPASELHFDRPRFQYIAGMMAQLGFVQLPVLLMTAIMPSQVGRWLGGEADWISPEFDHYMMAAAGLALAQSVQYSALQVNRGRGDNAWSSWVSMLLQLIGLALVPVLGLFTSIGAPGVVGAPGVCTAFAGLMLTLRAFSLLSETSIQKSVEERALENALKVQNLSDIQAEVEASALPGKRKRTKFDSATVIWKVNPINEVASQTQGDLSV